MKILIGSGFAENIKSPKLFLERENYGNSFETIKKLKSELFFKILKREKIDFPKSIKFKPADGKWLIKSFNSFGGQNVNLYVDNKNLKPKEYLQEKIIGEQISVQFSAQKKEINILGIFEQVLKNPEKGNFFIKSLISKRVTLKFYEQIFSITKKIASIFKLNGLNSLDLLLSKKKLFLIEVNPRPGLGINIILKINKSLFSKKKTFDQINRNFFYSTSVIYSKKKIIINNVVFKNFKNFTETEELTEFPNAGDIIKVDEPICLLHLKSKNRNFLKKKICRKENFFLNYFERLNEKK